MPSLSQDRWEPSPAAADVAPLPEPPATRLSDDLQSLLNECGAADGLQKSAQGGLQKRANGGVQNGAETGGAPRTFTVAEIEARLHHRGVTLLMMLLAAPFLIPSVPGLSTPFGGALIVMGLQLARGREPGLPGFVLRRALPAGLLGKIVRLLLKIARWIERHSRPRSAFIDRFRPGPREGGGFPGMARLVGLGIASGGLFLFLPIMVPVMNTLPTLSILLLAAGMMERDGAFILAGHVFGVLAWLYFGAWIWLGKAGMERLF